MSRRRLLWSDVHRGREARVDHVARTRRRQAPVYQTAVFHISTDIIWPHGAEILDRLGLRDRLWATGCPPIALRLLFDVGPFPLKGGVTDTNAGRGGFCPRRTVLDKLLVDAAVEAGAELREGFTYSEVNDFFAAGLLARQMGEF